MSSETITLIISALAGFIISFIGFSAANSKKDLPSVARFLPFSVIYLTFLALGLIAFIAFPRSEDFIFDYSFNESAVFFLMIPVVFFSFYFLKHSTKAYLAALIAVSIPVIFFPSQYNYFSELPLWSAPLITIVLWFAFTAFYPILNGVDAVAGVNALSVSLGVFILSLSGGAPILLGAQGLFLAVIMLAFLIFNWYPARIRLSSSVASAIGFILGGICLRASYEGIGSCILILNMFFITETVFALLKKLTLRSQYQELLINTAYCQANLSGFAPESVINNVVRLNIVMIIFAWFAMYAPNFYSIPVLSFIICTWYLSKLKNWQTANRSLKEINRDFVNNLKNNFSTIKDSIKNKDDGTK